VRRSPVSSPRCRPMRAWRAPWRSLTYYRAASRGRTQAQTANQETLSFAVTYSLLVIGDR
jgi:hypothetical protein